MNGSLILLLIVSALFAVLFVSFLRRWQAAKQEVAVLAADKARLEQALADRDQQLQDRKAASEEMKTSFESLAARIFEERSAKFEEQTRSHLLQPIQNDIREFRQHLDDANREAIARTASLKTEVERLASVTTEVSQDATKLADAIKGDAKTQGDWGELIVERIFEASGLLPETHYEAQVSQHSEDGKLLRPDFVVHLPDHKHVVVDSKVSLTAYERYCSADTEADRAKALKEHIASVRKHLEELTAKKYEDLLGEEKLDFVLMCIPIEPAFQLVMQQDSELLHDLGRGNVVACGPTTLMMALKMIGQVWNWDSRSKNAEKIAKIGGALHDKFVGFYEKLCEAQKKMHQGEEALDDAMRKLGTGRGNVMSKVDELRSLGAPTRKVLEAEFDHEEEPVAALLPGGEPGQ